MGRESPEDIQNQCPYLVPHAGAVGGPGPGRCAARAGPAALTPTPARSPVAALAAPPLAAHDEDAQRHHPRQHQPEPRPRQASAQRPPADGPRNCVSVEKQLERSGGEGGHRSLKSQDVVVFKRESAWGRRPRVETL